MKVHNLVIYLIISILFIGCATEKPTGKTEAEVLYKEAKNLMDDGHYIMAIEKLNGLKNQYPYSFYATPAELMQADILFLQENYVEAAAAYMIFRDFHPRHKKIPYVIYKIAESYYQQIPDTYDRDLSSAVEAIKYYNELLASFGPSKYTNDAGKKIKRCQQMIRDKEKYIADFYFKTEVFEAARWRYLSILENFNNKGLRKHSMARVVESSYMMKDYQSCVQYADRYKQFLVTDAKERVKELKNICRNHIE